LKKFTRGIKCTLMRTKENGECLKKRKKSPEAKKVSKTGDFWESIDSDQLFVHSYRPENELLVAQHIASLRAKSSSTWLALGFQHDAWKTRRQGGTSWSEASWRAHRNGEVRG
jgi:hypothetical protein